MTTCPKCGCEIDDMAEVCPGCMAEPMARLACLQSDPDTGFIKDGHVCKHGVRWPHECKPCADDAWERHQLEMQVNPLENNGQSHKYFVDCLTSDGWRRGTIAWPIADAKIVAAGYKSDHPDWLVEINQLQGTP